MTYKVSEDKRSIESKEKVVFLIEFEFQEELFGIRETIEAFIQLSHCQILKHSGQIQYLLKTSLATLSSWLSDTPSKHAATSLGKSSSPYSVL